ncbi:MAG: NAD(P)H-dependent oxidoreductase subunit E [Chitinophagaceae bacterium]|nr:NAD(P)H-dependent oxidoreductase subunit E [Chitinophagaceae bacterium]
MSENLGSLSGRKGLQENLFEKLGTAAENSGTVSTGELEALRREYLFGKASLFGTVSFYDFMKPANKGKKVYVCNGSACLTAGTQEELRQKLGTRFTEEETGEICCLGRCHENSAFQTGGINYSGSDIRDIDTLLKNDQPEEDSYPVTLLEDSVFNSPAAFQGEYYSLLSDCLRHSREHLLQELKLSGLRGRGGAGFPMAFKLEACMNAASATKFIVCNADEGDPGAYSDRYIMEKQPHALLLGMMIAGYIAGAATGVIYIRAEYPESVNRIRDAIVTLENEGWLGDHIKGTQFSFQFKMIKAQGAYICGEETALLSSIEGQRPEVRVRPPYPAQSGLFNQPTLVNNVETLACLPYIFKQGASAFKTIGTKASAGTKLISLDGHFNKPGICEVPMGTPLSTVIYETGGGFKSKIKALHIGGPLGGLIPVHKIPELTVDFESFRNAGFLLGHASIVCIPESFPMIRYLEHLFRFTAHESCGKCFPCRLGSVRGYEMLEKAQQENYKIDPVLMKDLLDTLEKGSLCALGGGLPLPVKNALAYFKDELQGYFMTSD